MKSQEIIELIKNYIDTPLTTYAIMLNGSWGIGKSYFISNELRSSLFGYKSNAEKENNKKQKHKKRTKIKSDKKTKKKYNSIKISMYGVENKFELAKKIYVAIRTGQESEDDEAIATGKLVTKSIISMLMGSLHINTNPKDLENLYNSINLKDTLLIFEDIERMSMDLFEFLGYVNNLVEQDNVKVLLVAYEDEILKKLNEKENTKYETIKEKTIYETINYEPDISETIKNINKIYLKNSLINIYFDDDLLNDLKDLLYSYKNFRTYIFAVRKAERFFKQINITYFSELPPELIKEIISKIIVISFEFKSGKLYNKQDDGKEKNIKSKLLNYYCSTQYSFCVYFVIENSIGNIDETIKYLIHSYNRNLKEIKKSAFAKIYYWQEYTEDEILESIKAFKEFLETYESDFKNFQELFYNLILLKESGLDFNFNEMKNLMLKNLIFCDFNNIVYFQTSYKELYVNNFNDEDSKKLFENFDLLYKNRLKDYEFHSLKKAINKSIKSAEDFDTRVQLSYGSLVFNEVFIGLLDIDKFADKIINGYDNKDSRIVFDKIYEFYYHQNKIFNKDRENLIMLCNILDESIKQNKVTGLKKANIQQFIKDIQGFLTKQY